MKKKVTKRWKGQVSCCTNPKALQMVLSTRIACSKARRLHRESRNETADLLPSHNPVCVFSFKNTAPTDARKSVVKEQVGFNLQTERLTPVNLKFIKFITPSPNVLWEFSPSRVNAPRTAPLFIYALSPITASLDLVCQHSPGAKFCSQGSGRGNLLVQGEVLSLYLKSFI